MEPIALPPGEGEVLVDEPPRTSRIKAARGELLLTESTYPANERGARPHIHRQHVDSFYVLEGELEIHLGEEVLRATPGSYALAPPHVVHWFRNVSDSPTGVLNFHTPGGFAEYRRELEELRTLGIEPEQAFFERHDIFDVS